VPIPVHKCTGIAPCAATRALAASKTAGEFLSGVYLVMKRLLGILKRSANTGWVMASRSHYLLLQQRATEVSVLSVWTMQGPRTSLLHLIRAALVNIPSRFLKLSPSSIRGRASRLGRELGKNRSGMFGG
jgi:hypothetical protein